MVGSTTTWKVNVSTCSLRFGIVRTYPGSTTEFTGRGNINEDRLLVLGKRIDNVGTVLEDLIVHVTLTTRETSPVGQDHHRQLLTIVEVAQSLGGLEGGVGVPHTTSLLGDHLHRIRVGRVSRGDILHRPSLDSNHTHRDTAETGTTDNNGTGPAAKGLLEGVLIEQTRQEALVILLTTDEPAGVVGLLSRGEVGHITVPAVRESTDRDRRALLVGNKRHPLDDLLHTGKVIVGSHV